MVALQAIGRENESELTRSRAEVALLKQQASAAATEQATQMQARAQRQQHAVDEASLVAVSACVLTSCAAAAGSVRGLEQRLREMASRIEALRSDVDRERDGRLQAELQATQLQAQLAQAMEQVREKPRRMAFVRAQDCSRRRGRRCVCETGSGGNAMPAPSPEK